MWEISEWGEVELMEELSIMSQTELAPLLLLKLEL